ncbi:MAG: OmpH family outer membrane protein [Acetobacteraceae bacterium]
MRILTLALAALVAAILLRPGVLFAQSAPSQGPGWFIPGPPHHAAPAPTAHPAPAPAPQPAPAALPALPPVPQLPALPKSPAPPPAVMGVLSVPDVYRQSTAVQAMQKIITERRNALSQDAIKEQSVWRTMQTKLADQRAKLTPAEIRSQETALQNRITNAQRDFAGRNQQIEEAAQYALGEVNRILVAVIRQVAESRGMNLVLHREQVALNMNAYDITDEVAKQLNKILPHVTVPPDSAMPIRPNPEQAVSGLAPETAAAPAGPLPLPPALPAGGPPKP